MASRSSSLGLSLAEIGLLPDALVRHGIRRRLAARSRRLARAPRAVEELVPALARGPLAVAGERANEQHYELPPAFFAAVLGPRLKYSCCDWSGDVDSLAGAEEQALARTCERAGIADGMSVLDLGCGWGSLALWIAERWPRCRVTALSNSAAQGRFIRRRAAAAGLAPIETVTTAIDRFAPGRRFDRIVSIEMFEHLRNYAELFRRLGDWLEPGGRLFVHHFCHRDAPYFFEDRGPGDWMARHFFTGGLMPSEHLLDRFRGPLRLERRWRLGGRHYERTCNAWLRRLDRRRGEVREVLRPVYGAATNRWVQRWRIFFLACAELFAYRGGGEWFVSHTLWRPAAAAGLPSAAASR